MKIKVWSAGGVKRVQKCLRGHNGQAAQRILMAAGMSVGVVILIGAMVLSLYAQSLQPYPNKPIRLIIGMVAGGNTDILGRIVAQKLAERLGQPVMAENRPGAGSNIAYELAAKARPDGYTFVLASGSISVSPSLFKKLNYDPIKDFTPVALVAQAPYVVIIRSSLPVKNLKEFVEYAKANPGKLNYGSSGVGATPHLAAALLKSLTKIDIQHVAYKGGAQAMVALLGGEIDMQVTNPSTAVPQIQAGKVRALAVLSHERLPSLPDVPTIKEAGVDNCEVTTSYGILAPAGTPKEIVNRLNAEWFKSAAMPDTKEQILKNECDPMPPNTPEQYAEFIKTEIVRWAKVVKDANISRID